MNNNTTNALSEALSTKTKHLIIATKGEQHIKVEPNHLYEINIKEGEVLTSDVNLIAKKVGNDLEVLLENNATVIFDNYFEVCAPDLSCLVSLPSKEGLYYVVDDTVTTLADGSQIVHSYGDEQALSSIAEGQSGLFETSFNEVFLAGEISAFTLAPLLALGGGSGGSSTSSSSDNNNLNEVEQANANAIADVPNEVRQYITDAIAAVDSNTDASVSINDTDSYFIYGSSGDDDFWGSLLGGKGDDVIYGDAGNDNIAGHDGDDILIGGTGDDKIWGYDDNDWLFGGAGADTLHGDSGDDFLYGGSGDDTLWGNAGDDTFVFYGNDGIDTIKDFTVSSYLSENDTIDLSGIVGLTETNISLTDDGTDTTLQIDGSIDTTIILENVSGKSVSDLITDGSIVL